MGVWFSPLESVEAIGTNIPPQQRVVIGRPDSNRLMQESNVPMHVEIDSKLVMIRMKSMKN